MNQGDTEVMRVALVVGKVFGSMGRSSVYHGRMIKVDHGEAELGDHMQ